MLVKLNRRRSLQDLTKSINEGKPHSFCSKAGQRKLSNLGYKCRAVRKKVVVREMEKRKRVLWCHERKDWTVDEHWHKWIFSDESQIVLSSNNRLYVWRKDDEVTNPHLMCPVPRRKFTLVV